ncbi:MAG: alpha/beta fold hydrolase [Deltaproteobacteria bacterium]|nr:alpha/beta fold hydrolase [Deltaproteobacteria bacterium]MBW2393938.1 alpha/beta fold hydrolase [Deltaproteobacteria bacterium]
MTRLSVFASLFLVSACAFLPPGSPDPVGNDPRVFDSAHPPELVETRFESHGDRMNAIIYVAQGAGPHPTVILLHGFPGNERNLDLAQAIRRGGWNVVFFHYRGAWGSDGVFSFGHVIEDVASVVAAVRSEEFAAAHRIDASQIALVGHSMGGFAALVSAADLSEVACVASLAGANLGAFAMAAADPEQQAAIAASLDGWAGPIRGMSGAELVAELRETPDRFDTIARAPLLARKPVLLLAGARDEVTPTAVHHDPLVAALSAANAPRFDSRVLERSDHSFSSDRIAVARILVDWLRTGCDVP